MINSWKTFYFTNNSICYQEKAPVGCDLTDDIYDQIALRVFSFPFSDCEPLRCQLPTFAKSACNFPGWVLGLVSSPLQALSWRKINASV